MNKLYARLTETWNNMEQKVLVEKDLQNSRCSMAWATMENHILQSNIFQVLDFHQKNEAEFLLLYRKKHEYYALLTQRGLMEIV